VILDEASYCWPVRPVWTVRCFYGPLTVHAHKAYNYGPFTCDAEVDVDVDVDEICERRRVASLPASSILQ